MLSLILSLKDPTRAKTSFLPSFNCFNIVVVSIAIGFKVVAISRASIKTSFKGLVLNYPIITCGFYVILQYMLHNRELCQDKIVQGKPY